MVYFFVCLRCIYFFFFSLANEKKKTDIPMFSDNVIKGQVRWGKIIFMNNLTKLTKSLTCMQELNIVVAVQNF